MTQRIVQPAPSVTLAHVFEVSAKTMPTALKAFNASVRFASLSIVERMPIAPFLLVVKTSCAFRSSVGQGYCVQTAFDVRQIAVRLRLIVSTPMIVDQVSCVETVAVYQIRIVERTVTVTVV